MANAQFDDYESAREHADREATRTKRHMAVLEDEGEFYVMAMRNAGRYARHIPIRSSSSTRPNRRRLGRGANHPLPDHETLIRCLDPLRTPYQTHAGRRALTDVQGPDLTGRDSRA